MKTNKQTNKQTSKQTNKQKPIDVLTDVSQLTPIPQMADKIIQEHQAIRWHRLTIDPLHIMGMQPIWRTKQNKFSLLGIEIYSHVKKILCTSHLNTPPHPHPTPPRACPEKSGDNHLVFTSLCFPGGWGEHSLSLRSLIFRWLQVVWAREWANTYDWCIRHKLN